MESPAPLVSVIIPSFNMARFLPLAVESALAQSYANLEVQIVDDGSYDETTQVVRRWQSEPRVHVHRQENGGLSQARNTGIALTHGPFIALLDADDIWEPYKLELQMQRFAERPGIGVLYSGYQRIDREGAPLPTAQVPMYRGRVSGQLLIQNFIPASTAVIRRECFERCGGFDTALRTGEDYDMWLRLSAHYDFDYITERTLRYRIWGGQLSTDFRGRFETGIRTMQRFLDAHPGVVDPATVRHAWANTYTGRGNVTLWRAGKRAGAVQDYLRALRYQPTYWPAWRAILRSFLTRRAPRWRESGA